MNSVPNVSTIVAYRHQGSWGLTPAVFRLVPVRLKWLYWAIFDPAFPQWLFYTISIDGI